MRSTCRGRRHAKQRVKARFLVKNWEENMARNLFACQNSLGSITVTSAIFDRPIWQAFTPMRHAYYTKHFGISLGTCHEPSTSHMLFNLQWDETVSIVALKDRRCAFLVRFHDWITKRTQQVNQTSGNNSPYPPTIYHLRANETGDA